MTKCRGIIKKVIPFLMAVLMIIQQNNFIYAEQLNSPINNVLYEEKEVTKVTNGVKYEVINRFTGAGWLDIYSMIVDLETPYIDINVLESTEKVGGKETLTKLIESNNAIAGINGDFFDTRRNPSDSMGIVIENGKVSSAYNGQNIEKDFQGVLTIDDTNNAMIDYLKVKLIFTNGYKETQIGSINKVSTINYPTYVDRQKLDSTKEIDSRQDKITKIIVENDKIIRISNEGEVVDIPELGYVILVPQKFKQELLSKFKIGDLVMLDQRVSVDVDKLKVGLSGGGKIISDGKYIEDTGLVIAAKSRHPRSAVGITKDNKLLLVAVDGRGESIGVNHKELGDILLELGAVNAMHYDGGGSTTIASTQEGSNDIKVINNPSDKTQRRILNGLGIVTKAPKGNLENLIIKAGQPKAFVNNKINIEVTGTDTYGNPIEIDSKQILWQTEGINGLWEDNAFYPKTIGKGTITAYYQGKSKSVEIESLKYPQIIDISPKIIQVSENGLAKINLVGITEEGYKYNLSTDTVNWSFDNNLGEVENGIFKASDKKGQSLLIGTMGETEVKGYIAVGDTQKLVDTYEGNISIEAVKYPDYVVANVSEISGYNSSKSINLNYKFEEQKTQTQAAYINFTEPYVFEGNPIGLGLAVKGDNSGNWLRGRIIDSEGQKYNITFSNEISWGDWKQVKAIIPESVKYPISLDRLYVTALSTNEPIESNLAFDDLLAIYQQDIDYSLIKTKQLKDPLRKQFTSKKEDEIEITVFGSTDGKNRLIDNIVQDKVIKIMNKQSDLALFSGYTDLNSIFEVPFIMWNDKYIAQDFETAKIFNLATSKNGMKNTDPQQWIKFQQDLKQTTQNNIFILLNKNPLDKSEFTDKREGQLLHNMLKELREETGKNIFVINGSGYDFNIEVVEGIRYMDINGLWYNYNNGDIDLTDAFKLLKFRINGDDIYYDVQNVYPGIIVN